MPPRLPFCGSVTASTTATSATGALWMKIFSPLMIQSSPSRTARVLMLRASEPAPGSVIAKQL